MRVWSLWMLSNQVGQRLGKTASHMDEWSQAWEPCHGLRDCQEWGINHLYSPPSTPIIHILRERKNRHLVNQFSHTSLSWAMHLRKEKVLARKEQASLSTRLGQGEKMLRPLFLPSKGKHTVLPPGLGKGKKKDARGKHACKFLTVLLT